MDAPLPALPLAPLSPRRRTEDPFTPAMAAESGVSRSVLLRLFRDGQLRRPLRGVYVDATVPDSLELRGRSLALLVSDRVVVERSAAWLHGVDLGGDPPERVQTLGRTGRVGTRRLLSEHEVERIGGTRVTTPLRTALDLGRRLAPEPGLAALDGLLRTGRFTHAQLMAELVRFTGQYGITRLRRLAALADARAATPAESALRLRWYDARLPTPIPAHRVDGIRLALALPVQRFAVVLPGQLTGTELSRLAAQGWRVVLLPPSRVLSGDPQFVIGHLEREFHQHLLAQVIGAGEPQRKR